MSVQNSTCHICGDGALRHEFYIEHKDYNGQSGDVSLVISTCANCGSEQATADDMRQNKRAMIAFKKRVDGLLSGTEIRALREQWSITQAQAAQIFGGGPVAFSKYESDDVMQSEGMDKLIRLAAEVPDGYRYLAKKAGLLAAPRIVQSISLSTSRKWVTEKPRYLTPPGGRVTYLGAHELNQEQEDAMYA